MRVRVDRLLSKGRVDRATAVGRHLLVRLQIAAFELLRARYDVGFAYSALYYAVDGDDLLGAFGDATGISFSELQRLRRVSQAISEQEFIALADIKDGHGFPLSWAHFECLAKVRSPKRRRALAEAAARHGWSARVLRARRT